MNYTQMLDRIREECTWAVVGDTTVELTHTPSGTILSVNGPDIHENVKLGLFEMVYNQFPHRKLSDPQDLRKLRGKHTGETALLVGGGISGGNWRNIYDALTDRDGKPPVVISMNGCNQDRELSSLIDYHLCLECDPPLPVWQWIPLPRATVFMNWRTAHPEWMGAAPDVLEGYRKHCHDLILVERSNGEHGPPEDHVRNVNHGLWYGPFITAGTPPLGTGFNQLPHLAGILGCAECHSTGVDLCIKDQGRHHWYKDELYNDPSGRKPSWEVIEHEGLQTFEWWRQSAFYLVGLRWLWWQQGLRWYDYSEGLLQKCGFWMMGSDIEAKISGQEVIR